MPPVSPTTPLVPASGMEPGSAGGAVGHAELLVSDVQKIFSLADHQFSVEPLYLSKTLSSSWFIRIAVAHL